MPFSRPPNENSSLGNMRDECDKVSSSLFSFRTLDRTIKEAETTIAYLEEELKNRQNELKELKVIRKQVTPEIEAAAHALRKVGLI